MCSWREADRGDYYSRWQQLQQVAVVVGRDGRRAASRQLTFVATIMWLSVPEFFAHGLRRRVSGETGGCALRCRQPIPQPQTRERASGVGRTRPWSLITFNLSAVRGCSDLHFGFWNCAPAFCLTLRSCAPSTSSSRDWKQPMAARAYSLRQVKPPNKRETINNAATLQRLQMRSGCVVAGSEDSRSAPRANVVAHTERGSTNRRTTYAMCPIFTGEHQWQSSWVGRTCFWPARGSRPEMSPRAYVEERGDTGRGWHGSYACASRPQRCSTLSRR